MNETVLAFLDSENRLISLHKLDANTNVDKIVQEFIVEECQGMLADIEIYEKMNYQIVESHPMDINTSDVTISGDNGVMFFYIRNVEVE